MLPWQLGHAFLSIVITRSSSSGKRYKLCYTFKISICQGKIPFSLVYNAFLWKLAKYPFLLHYYCPFICWFFTVFYASRSCFCMQALPPSDNPDCSALCAPSILKPFELRPAGLLSHGFAGFKVMLLHASMQSMTLKPWLSHQIRLYILKALMNCLSVNRIIYLMLRFGGNNQLHVLQKV